MPDPRLLIARAGRDKSLLRRLPADLGAARFPASTEGGLKFLKRRTAEIDKPLTDFARDYIRPSMTVWDVGANVGLFTFAAAGLAGPEGQVLAVEPDAWLAANLRRAARRNHGTAPVRVLCAAASGEYGVASFLIANRSRATNYLAGHGNSTTEGVREEQLVPTLRIDELLDRFGAPDVVKIDVEGAEVDVLRGAERLLKTRPILLVETEESRQAEVADLLAPCAYRYIDAETKRAVSQPGWLTACLPR